MHILVRHEISRKLDNAWEKLIKKFEKRERGQKIVEKRGKYTDFGERRHSEECGKV